MFRFGRKRKGRPQAKPGTFPPAVAPAVPPGETAKTPEDAPKDEEEETTPMEDIGALNIKAKIKAAAAAVAKNKYAGIAAKAMAPDLLNDTKNVALKQLEKVAPGAGTAAQKYVVAKQTEIEQRIKTGYVITAVAAVGLSYLLFGRNRKISI